MVSIINALHISFLIEAAIRICSSKSVFIKKSAKTPVLESLLNNVAGFFLKKTPTQLFSCEYSEMIKKSFFH